MSHRLLLCKLPTYLMLSLPSQNQSVLLFPSVKTRLYPHVLGHHSWSSCCLSTVISLCAVAKWNQMRLSVPPKFLGFFPLLMCFLCLIRPSLLHIQILPHLKSISMLPPPSSLPLSPLIALPPKLPRPWDSARIF